MQGINVVNHYINKAWQFIQTVNQEINVQKMNYHHLDDIADHFLNNAYIMKTFVHVTDSEQALHKFYCILRLSEHLVLYEYDHQKNVSVPVSLWAFMNIINKYTVMSVNTQFD